MPILDGEIVILYNIKQASQKFKKVLPVWNCKQYLLIIMELNSFKQAEDQKMDFQQSKDIYQLFNAEINHDLSQGQSSDYLHDYLSIMNLLNIEKIDHIQIMEQLISNGIRYDCEGKFCEDIDITLFEFTHNFEAMKIQVKYGYFSVFLNLINVYKKSPISNLGQCISGSFGQVYHYNIDKKQLAIKIIKIYERKFQNTFRLVIKQYFILLITSSLKIGPKVQKIFGFDIVIFSDYFCFGMQYCQIGKFFPQSQKQLQRKLHLLHMVNIVHLDIKPENIGFSQQINESIFIDFGLSKSIKQKIGKKSLIPFTGSMSYCSDQMLFLFANDDYKFIDLYYNDAICLKKSIMKMKQSQNTFEDDKEEQYKMTQMMLLGIMSNNHMFLNEEAKIFNIKCILFDLSCNYQIDPALLSKYEGQFIKYHYFLQKFISILPQTLTLINFYKKYLKIHQTSSNHDIEIHEYKGEGKAQSDLIDDLFQYRTKCIHLLNNKLINLNDRQSQKNTQYNILFERQNITRYRQELYWLVLARFIRINSYNKNFQAKMLACIICNDIYQFQSNNVDQMQLYRKTIQFLFYSALKAQQSSSLQILINLVETVTILELLCEDDYIMSFGIVLKIKGDFVEKMIVMFQYITSLEFISQKFKTNYRYEHLCVKVISSLNDYLDSCQNEIDKKDYKILWKKLKYVIIQKIDIDNASAYSNFKQVFMSGNPKQYQLLLKKINQMISTYIFYKQVKISLKRHKTCRRQYLQLLQLFLNRNNYYYSNFTYLHFAVFNIAEQTHQSFYNYKIYNYFYDQMKYFQEHTFFIIYLYNRIRLLVSSTSLNLLKQRKEIVSQVHFQATNQSVVEYEQIFAMLDYIVKNNNQFHQCIGFLLINNPSIHYDQKCKIYISSLIRNNRQKIIKLSKPTQTERGKHSHMRGIKYEIVVISNLLECMNKFSIVKYSQLTQILQKIMEECGNRINQLSCFQCKIHSLTVMKQLFANYLHSQGKIQQSFLVCIDMFTLFSKNNQLRKNGFQILIHMIRRWCLHEQIFYKYSLIGFLYGYMKQTNGYCNIFIQICQFNIFLYLYVYVAENSQQKQMVQFMIKVMNALSQIKSINAINNFYYTLTHIIQINRKTDCLQSLKVFNDEIVGLLIFGKDNRQLKENPYIALYLTAMMEIRIISEMDIRSLKTISLLVGHLDSYSKTIINKQYFLHFLIYLPMPMKKDKYVGSLFLKQSAQQFTFKFIRQHKQRSKIKGKKVKILHKFIKKYHRNLGNMI